MMNQKIDRLTYDGIRQLLSFQTLQHQQIILQLLDCRPNFENVYLCNLSDGYCFISGVLIKDSQNMFDEKIIDTYSIIKLLPQDIIIHGVKQQHMFSLKKCQLIDSKICKSIGIPMPFQVYREHGFQNNQGSNNLKDGLKYSSIAQIRKGENNWTLQVLLLRKPDKLMIEHQIMNMKVQDKTGDIIQMVCFDQLAMHYFKKLQQGSWYVIRNAQLQWNKRINEYQLKIIRMTTIIQDPTANPTQIINEQQSIKKQEKQQFNLKKFQQNNKLGMKFPQNVKITGLVIEIKILNNFLGRSLKIIDKQMNQVEIILWKQCQNCILQGQTYLFQNMRIKEYKNLISLHSKKFLTIISISDIKIQAQKNNMSNFMNCLKHLPQNCLINSIEKMKNSTDNHSYWFTLCYIVINLQSLRYRNSDDRKKFFFITCQDCNNNHDFQISQKFFFCSVCRSNQIRIHWNIRVLAIDEQNEILCGMNDNICQKLLGYPRQGFLLYSSNKQQFRNLLIKINYTWAIYKFKINIKNQCNKFYNILQMYKTDQQQILQYQMNLLKQINYQNNNL